jgi:DnaJ-class molecular chaperone
MGGLRVTHCRTCGGDGGFSEPVSMDPFSGRIHEYVYACDACGGTGEIEIELQEIEMDDLEEMAGP